MRKIKGKKRIVLNKKMGRKTIEAIHERFGHIRASQMIELMVKQFYFPNMPKKIIENCVNCEVCLKNKSRKGRNFGLMSQRGGPLSRRENSPSDGFGETRLQQSCVRWSLSLWLLVVQVGSFIEV